MCLDSGFILARMHLAVRRTVIVAAHKNKLFNFRQKSRGPIAHSQKRVNNIVIRSKEQSLEVPVIDSL